MTWWWGRFERFLATDPYDIGCDEAIAELPVYVEQLAAGVDAAASNPGLASHLAACGPCEEDARGMLAAVRDHDLQL